LRTAASIAGGLQVFPEAMRANLRADGGLVMAEAYMMRLADQLGRERAHDVVYEAVGHCRATGEPLFTALRAVLPTEVAATIEELPPESYVGRPHETSTARFGPESTATGL